MQTGKDCYEVADAGVLRVYPTDRFKTGALSCLTVLEPDIRRTPLQHLLYAVLCRGTEAFPTVASLNRRMDELYAAGLSVRSTRYGNHQIFGFRTDFLEPEYIPDGTDVMGGMLDILEQILFHPRLESGRFQGSFVESEKKIQCDAIRSAAHNPQAYAVRRCREMLFGDDPYIIPTLGTEEMVSSFTPDDLMREAERLFGTSPARGGVPLDFVYTGSASPAFLVERLEDRFGSYRAGKQEKILTPIPTARGELVRAEEEMPVSQGRLVIGIPTGVTLTSPDFPAMLVANEILGVSPASKLFLNVREKKSLCYHCSSSYDIYKGVIYVTCGMKSQNRDAAEEEIFRQLADLRDGVLSDEELTLAKKSLSNSYRQIPDNPSALESYEFGRALFGVRISVEQTMARFTAVTREQVVAAAQKLTPDALFFLRGTKTDGEGGESDDD